MLDVDNTSKILYRYLRILDVKVSIGTICRLQDTPLGDSMRGMSDTLDALHVNNAVYQLPKEYLEKLDSPFIAVINDGDDPFCLVERIEENDVVISANQASHLRMSKTQFRRLWSGAVLVAEKTEDTLWEKTYRIKNLIYQALQYKLLIIGIIVSLFVVVRVNTGYINFVRCYIAILCTGILVSVAIIYKEMLNDRFMNRFCKIGKAIDCNEVLHSKYAHVAGIGLGELAFLYFVTFLLFAVICPDSFYGISTVGGIVAILFTIFSVVYQLFIIRKICLLCMLINLIVWSSCIALYLSINGLHDGYFSIQAILSFVAVGGICLMLWLQMKSIIKAEVERRKLKTQLVGLFDPNVFQHLLELKPVIRETLPEKIALNNQVKGENQLMLITNPSCRNCANAHKQLRGILSEQPVLLAFLTAPKDHKSIWVAQVIITAYLVDGWEKAMLLLDEWYQNQSIKEPDHYTITDEAISLWKQQQMYCWKQNINQTPTIIINGHYMPDAYQWKELKYVLT